MRPDRRTVVAGAVALAAAVALGPAASAHPPDVRRLVDEALLAGQPSDRRAIIIPEGAFIEPAFVAALAAGRYEAKLTPANAVLLLEALRELRVPAQERRGLIAFAVPIRA